MDQVGQTRAWARWRRAWMFATSPGVCLALLMWGLGTTLALAVVAAIMGALVPLMGRPQPDARSSNVAARHGGTSAAAAVVAVGLAALASLSAAAGALVLGGLLFTTPAARWWLTCRLGAGRSQVASTHVPQQRSAVPSWAPGGLPGDRADDARLLDLPAAGMTTAELCRAWRHSLIALRHATTPGQRARLATLRQSYLDEIEKQDPAALQAWLASGARAASGPERFLAPRRLRPPAT